MFIVPLIKRRTVKTAARFIAAVKSFRDSGNSTAGQLNTPWIHTLLFNPFCLSKFRAIGFCKDPTRLRLLLTIRQLVIDLLSTLINARHWQLFDIRGTRRDESDWLGLNSDDFRIRAKLDRVEDRSDALSSFRCIVCSFSTRTFPSSSIVSMPNNSPGVRCLSIRECIRDSQTHFTNVLRF